MISYCVGEGIEGCADGLRRCKAEITRVAVAPASRLRESIGVGALKPRLASSLGDGTVGGEVFEDLEGQLRVAVDPFGERLGREGLAGFGAQGGGQFKLELDHAAGGFFARFNAR